ncbi:MAG: MIP/aquaporin family protein [Alphaproteobacteria bacterium]|nr:MIP/aquaporin family protein [Alphaproteobacteria bacterium]|tara:strand:+ start:135 stop:806 length:672 start_codon:yes stop_codon:yes gene_type:complete
MTNTFLQKLGAEFIGTAGLLATVIGSGIMGETLAGGNVAIALLGNTIATGAILVVLIWVFGPISGAHFNPAVTIAFLVTGEISARDAAIFIVVQVLGALVGMLVAHGMFDLALIQESTKVRTGIGQWFAEGVATFGLVATIFGCIRARPDAVAMAVGLYITAGYWFTASTSFANPAVTIARSFTDTFSGIQPANAPAFIGMQIVGAILAVLVIGWLWRDAADD